MVLPQRVLTSLLLKGRSNVAQLSHNTSLGPKQVRHGLAVLLQQNLLYHEADYELLVTYDANPEACYNLVRGGKVLAMIESQYGVAEREVVQMLLLSGHARVADLESAFQNGPAKNNGHMNGSHNHTQEVLSGRHVLVVLARLIQAEIIHTVQPDDFRSPIDVFRSMLAKELNTGEKLTAKERKARDITAREKFRDYLGESKSLKRQLDLAGPRPNKLRKLQNGNAHQVDEDHELPHLDVGNLVNMNLRVNANIKIRQILYYA